MSLTCRSRGSRGSNPASSRIVYAMSRTVTARTCASTSGSPAYTTRRSRKSGARRPARDGSASNASDSSQMVCATSIGSSYERNHHSFERGDDLGPSTTTLVTTITSPSHRPLRVNRRTISASRPGRENAPCSGPRAVFHVIHPPLTFMACFLHLGHLPVAADLGSAGVKDDSEPNPSGASSVIGPFCPNGPWARQTSHVNMGSCACSVTTTRCVVDGPRSVYFRVSRSVRLMRNPSKNCAAV